MINHPRRKPAAQLIPANKRSPDSPTNNSLRTNPPATHKLLLGVALALLSIFISTWCIDHKKQLAFMGGMAEEYFLIAVRLQQTGRFSLSEGDTLLFRPPGYCYLLSKVIGLSGGLPDLAKIKSQEELDRAMHGVLTSIYLAQAGLLAASVLIFSLWSTELYSFNTAAIISLAFSCCPYFTILTGLLQYQISHIFTLLLSGYVLFLAFKYERLRRLLFFLAGLLFGISTLIRPITLLMPAFVALACLLYLRCTLPSVLMQIALFTIGMSVVIAPWTYRNYQLSHRFIPVNAQSGVALYAATLKRLPFTANHYRWWIAYYDDGASVYSKTIGRTDASITNYVKHNLELDDAYATVTRDNLRRQPEVYISNLLTNMGLMLLCVNGVLVQVFEAIQHQYAGVDQKWFQIGNKQQFYDRSDRTLFECINAALVICLFAGFAVSMKDWRLLLTASLSFLCVVIAHIITHVDLMYYYVKPPFVFLLSGFILEACRKRRHVLCLNARGVYTCIGIILVGLNIVLCIRMCY